MSAADLLTSGGITDASSWVAAGSVTLRRNAASRATRPLTRYLPVTGQENFDLRAHIESAGHQVRNSQGVYVYGNTLPPPPGKKFRPMSFVWRNLKRGREGENVNEMKKEKDKMEVKRVK
jgi:hypothetical protein